MLLVDQYVHIGESRVPLDTARSAAEELLVSGWSGTELPELDVPSAPDNDAALADLMAKLGGVSG